MKRSFYIFLVIALTATACNKILDTTPQDFISPVNYYNTESDLESALAGVYDRLGDNRVYGQGMACYLVFSDEFFMKNQINGMNANIVDASTLEVNRHWEALYTGIERANMLLDNIDKAQQASEAKRNEVKGQALFLRAYYYFLLTDHYGPVPLKLHATKNPDETPLSGSPVKEIYEQIVKDMKEAEGLVKSVSDYGYNTRITKTTVQGMLTRVYLTMAGYPLRDVAKYADARSYADKVMQSGVHGLNPDFKQIYINHVKEAFDTKENLWEVEFKGTSQGEIQEGGTIGSYNGITCGNIDTGYGYDYVHATAKLYDAYAEGDQRRDWTVAPFRFVTTGTTVVRTNWAADQIYERSNGKWRREYELVLPRNQNMTGTNWPLLRYSDILLMFAEADNYLNSGPSAAAYEALNMVRRRGYGKDAHTPDVQADAPAGLSQQDFQELIMNERLREFAFEGIRKHDLIRWGVYVSVMQAQASEYQARMPAALKDPAIAQAQRITERAVVFPIPNSEMAVNPNIKQNPGW
ncbi:RagB/SusD family nutrient uptake outer membrane protein [Niabella beijingensis]|uniref:RagB/SusD family nutrient uptake outer membrane protein n=1 Tax=Niabella beijingensis TaxID=2872700 RepID=UPI001CC14D0A|nr:RagB/SusD family nutrient uptake outer membrane protein [Niabella beijingensis]MBZ4189292.1 RagB/SusD family nutrient uptake outer membrane protein [Niabella beijingensis]